MINGALDYEKHSLANVTELYTKGLMLRYPLTRMKQIIRPVHGGQGLKVGGVQLSPGDHTIYYTVRVTPNGLLTSPGTNPHFAEVTYTLHVRK